MNSNSCHVHVIVVTYNGKEWIDTCIQSLVSSNKKNEIIVIDNASWDGTQEIIRKKYSNISFIQNEKNLGFGQGNNVGIRKALTADTDYLFLLNQDAWVEEDTIEKLIEVAEQNPDYGIISPLHFNGKGDKLDYKFTKYILGGHNHALLPDIVLKQSGLPTSIEVQFVNAAAWLLPRKTIEIVGGFNPLFFHYGEDRDYINRVKFRGLKIGVCSQAKINHDRENRDNSYKSEIKRTSLLAKCLDINSDFTTYDDIIKQLKRNIFLNLFRFNISLLNRNWENYKFLSTNKEIIKKTRKIALRKTAFL
jgi:GT2 family glycosyltransferase